MARLAGAGALAAAAACGGESEASAGDSTPSLPVAAGAGLPGSPAPTAALATNQSRSLVDSAAWRAYRADTLPTGWRVADGMLTKSDVTGDIVTREQYGDFDLEFEWRIARGGNAGVFYRVTEQDERVYWTGPEYQLLDDANAPDGRNRLTSAGAAYGLYPAPAGVVRPAGEWNTGRIVILFGTVQHWLNGEKTAEYTLGSEDWETKVKASKFGEWPRYGRAARGHIAIQGDHDGDLALRNVRIRELP